MTKTSWIYTDSDWTYTIEFSKRGKLYSTHPNDKTRGNDFWEQHGNIIHFSYNDKFSLYEGRLTHKDTIRGKGYNKLMNWDFQLTRKK
ncbi:MAG: hypothetical protein GC171_16715 [Terrimonas sp.]|nr:hypothetical protein [Terrimonas sp.]